MHPAYVGVAVLALVAAEEGIANAQSNYRLAPVGGRSALLGGTGMTYGRDAAASFLNPATAVLIDDQRLSFSVNFYTLSLATSSRWFTPGPIDRSKFGELQIDDASKVTADFNALPSSLCFFLRAADVPFLKREKDPRIREARFGLCFATIQRESFTLTAEGFGGGGAPSVTRQAQTLASTYTRFAVGPTYAMQISRALAIGAAVHGTLTNHRSIISATATSYNGGPTPIDSLFYSGSRGNSVDVDALVGATLRWGKQTVGLSVQSPSLHVYGVGGASQQSHYDGAGSSTSLTASTGSFVSRTPMRVGLGTGLEANWGQAELDVFYSTPLGDAYSAELKGTRLSTANGVTDDRPLDVVLGERARGVVNAAVGGELFVSERISVLSGFSTDFSAVPRGALRGGLFNYNFAETHRIAASFGVGSHGTGGELLVGGELSYGWGERLTVNSYELPPRLASVSERNYQIMFLVAGSTSIRALKRAVKDIQEGVKMPNGGQRNPGELREKPRPASTPYNPATDGRSGSRVVSQVDQQQLRARLLRCDRCGAFGGDAGSVAARQKDAVERERALDDMHPGSPIGRERVHDVLSDIEDARKKERVLMNAQRSSSRIGGCDYAK